MGYTGEVTLYHFIMVAAHLLCSLHVPQATRRQQLACGSASWRQRAPAQRGVVSCLAYAAKSSPGVDKINKADLETLAKDILNKENEIKNAFQPGRPMPKVRNLENVIQESSITAFVWDVYLAQGYAAWEAGSKSVS